MNHVDIGEIEARLKKLIAMVSCEQVKTDAIRPNVALVKEGLALDSVAILQLLVAIEDEFEILLDDSQLTVATFESIGTLARYVETQRSAQQPS